MNIAYYFKNDQPIMLNQDPDNVYAPKQRLSIFPDGKSILNRQDTQIAKTNKIVNAQEKNLKMLEMIHNKVNEICT
jgi:hypothetical protein